MSKLYATKLRRSTDRYAQSDDDFPYQHRMFPSIGNMLAAVTAAAKAQPLLERADPFSYSTDVRVDRVFPDDFFKADGLSSLHTESVRMKCVFRGGDSPHEVWKRIRDSLRSLSREQAFEAVYAQARPCNTFNPTLGAAFYAACAKVIGTTCLDVLDPSAGWGDRLVAAYASRVVSTYTATDPNTDLTEPLHKLNASLAAVVRGRRCGPHVVTIRDKPFETLTVDDASFDVVFTSPPYFTLENYAPKGSGGTQSIDAHRGYRKWVTGFLRPLVRKGAAALRPGGVFALYLENVRADGKTYPLLDDAAAIADAEGLVPAGRIGFSMAEDGSERRTRFITVWRKTHP